MKFMFAFYIFLFSYFSVWGIDNTLTKEEKESGWELLFDGKSMNKWRNFKKKTINKKWVIKNGTMTLLN